MAPSPSAQSGPRIAIVGGGPAGLSAARLLAEQGFRNVTVFEAQKRIGGKSWSVPADGAMHDMGTCYSTLAHSTTNRWMRELRINQVALGGQHMDGQPYLDFVKAGPGSPLFIEGAKYVALWTAFQRRVAARPNDPEVLKECAMSVPDWLDRHNFKKMHRFMLRAFTTLGYGYLDEANVYQALKWCTPNLIMTGLFNQLRMPVEGWQTFWERLAETLDVRTGEAVVEIDRKDGFSNVTTAAGAYRFDHVLCTIPMDELARCMTLTNAERSIEDAVTWNSYVITLARVENWFDGHTVETYSEALEPGAPRGVLMAVRREPPGVSVDQNGKRTGLYLCAQYGSGENEAELIAKLREGIAARGATMTDVLVHKNWKYFSRYEPRAIRDGLLTRLGDVQGHRNTWFAGTTFSHEAVSDVVAFNRKLVARMTPRLKAA